MIRETLPRLPATMSLAGRLGWSTLGAALGLVPLEHAQAELDELGARGDALPLPTLRYLLWRASKDPSHLQAAQEAVMHQREHAPPEARDSMLEKPMARRVLDEARRQETSNRALR